MAGDGIRTVIAGQEERSTSRLFVEEPGRFGQNVTPQQLLDERPCRG